MSQSTTVQPMASPMTLMDTAWGFTRTQILKTGVELDIFTQIEKGNTKSKALAQAIGASERGVRILLNALVGLKVLEKTEEQYQLTEGARIFLSRSSPGGGRLQERRNAGSARSLAADRCNGRGLKEGGIAGRDGRGRSARAILHDEQPRATCAAPAQTASRVSA